MPSNISSSARKVQEALIEYGVSCRVVEMPQSTRTAADAARAAGCQVGQIVKSLIFKGKETQQPILVATSGANRVNEKKIANLISEPLAKADAEFVREKTGFAIGGVPPVAHAQQIQIYIDEDLLQYDEIWAAAGTPEAIFKLTPAELQKITAGRVISVK
ncbi:MAG: YbaK/EbsC family protein [bacterium]|nr:YbaK/EbsC family protein [bacterium]